MVTFASATDMKKRMRSIATSIFCAVLVASSITGTAADQTAAGAGNQTAIAISAKSPMVRSAFEFLRARAARIGNTSIRLSTLDAITNPHTCVAHRARLTDMRKQSIVQQLTAQGLLDPSYGSKIPGGLLAGVFPPLLRDGGECPQMPQLFTSAPGSSFGSHHSYPGGLAIHEAFNELTAREIAADYRAAYGHLNGQGLPFFDSAAASIPASARYDIELDENIVIAAPIWHDWAKSIVYQWNADGTEFRELPLGGNGKTDNYGSPGDSRTGGHHILGLAETMARHLPPELIVAQASAHSAPTMGNEYKLVNWIRTAAIIAGIDPVRAGYLRADTFGRLRLPTFRSSGIIDVKAGDRPLACFLPEDIVDNLSDANYTYSVPAVRRAELILTELASEFGYDPARVARYNNGFRNPVLSYLTAERLVFLIDDSGTDAVAAEIRHLVEAGLVRRGTSLSARR